jgi:hypothetical protein
MSQSPLRNAASPVPITPDAFPEPEKPWGWEAAAALWVEVYGEPPPVTCDPAVLIAILVAHLPATLPYQPGLVRGRRVIEETAEGGVSA